MRLLLPRLNPRPVRRNTGHSIWEWKNMFFVLTPDRKQIPGMSFKSRAEAESALTRLEGSRPEAPPPPPNPVIAASTPAAEAHTPARGSGFSAQQEQAMVSAMGRDIDRSGVEALIIPSGWSTAYDWNFDPNNPHDAIHTIERGTYRLSFLWGDGSWRVSLSPKGIHWNGGSGSLTEAMTRAAQQVERLEAAGRISPYDY